MNNEERARVGQCKILHVCVTFGGQNTAVGLIGFILWDDTPPTCASSSNKH